MEPQTHKSDGRLAGKRAWETPGIVMLTHVTEIVRGGGGKISAASADPGDPLKPPGQG